jgi:hypothetical protein
MEIFFKCVTVVNFNGTDMVLLRPEPREGRTHLMGEILKDLGRLREGATYVLMEVPGTFVPAAD